MAALQGISRLNTYWETKAPAGTAYGWDFDVASPLFARLKGGFAPRMKIVAPKTAR